jgi:uncharacterized protein (TIGR03437 family)
MGNRPAGLYTALITVTDPAALDAPQDISVTVAVGGAVPNDINLIVPANGTSASKVLSLSEQVTMNPQTSWVSATLDGTGTFRFTFPYTLRATRGTLLAGNYLGRLQVANSSFAGDNKVVNINFRVADTAVLEPSAERLVLRGLRGTRSSSPFSLVNRGQAQATASVSGSQPIANGGPTVSFEITNNNGTVTVDATNAQNGSYETTLNFAANGQNFNVPVSVNVTDAFPARAAIGGAVNNATFESGDPVARGAIVAVFGERLALTDPALAGSVPLPTQLTANNVRVLFNGQPVPLYFASDGQINIQIPYNAPLGTNELRVERSGEPGRRISVQVVDRAPRLLRLGIDDYGIVQNPDDTTLAVPAGILPGAVTRPARVNDVIVIYAVGLGPTSPEAGTGAAAPTNPLARVNGARVRFGPSFAGGVFVDPEYVGLAPGFVGLYQINVRVPGQFARNPRVPVVLTGLAGGESNVISIAVQ